MRIGIFDSGAGGELVALKLRKLLPQHDYIVVNDRVNAPYGEKSYDVIAQLTNTAIQPLLDCDIIVLACNTATAAAIDNLRNDYSDIKFVGFEPMIKPAAQISKTNRVTLLATTSTVNAPRTMRLRELYGKGLKIYTPNTTGWAKFVDSNQTEKIQLDEVVASVSSGSDVIILGCTHYIALEAKLKERFDNCTILEPTEAIAQQISQLADQPPK